MNSYLLFFLISLGSFFPNFGFLGTLPFDIYGFFAIFMVVYGRVNINRKYAGGLTVTFILTLLTSLRFGGDDLIPYGRIVLTLLDGVGVYWAFKRRAERESNTITDLLRFFLAAYLLCFILWLLLPTDDIFYFNTAKGWIATFPILFFMYLILKEKPRIALLVSVVFLFIAIDNRSRTLQLASFLCFLFLVFNFNYRRVLIVTIPSVLLAAVIGVPILSQAASSTEDLSTVYRFYMTANIMDYDFDRILFGVGVSRWQGDLSSFLSWTPNADDFFDRRANPHFLPSEIVIYGGLISLFIFVYFLHMSLRKSPVAPFLVALFASSFFTTNTGVERVFISITILLALWSSASFKPKKLNRFFPSYSIRKAVRFPNT